MFTRFPKMPRSCTANYINTVVARARGCLGGHSMSWSRGWSPSAVKEIAAWEAKHGSPFSAIRADDAAFGVIRHEYAHTMSTGKALNDFSEGMRQVTRDLKDALRDKAGVRATKAATWDKWHAKMCHFTSLGMRSRTSQSVSSSTRARTTCEGRFQAR